MLSQTLKCGSMCFKTSSVRTWTSSFPPIMSSGSPRWPASNKAAGSCVRPRLRRHDSGENLHAAPTHEMKSFCGTLVSRAGATSVLQNAMRHWVAIAGSEARQVLAQ
jgi:hypothetical protein